MKWYEGCLRLIKLFTSLGITGKATIIIGTLFIFLTLAGFSSFLFFIPVPLLAAMLLFDSYRMILLIKKVNNNLHLFTALLVGIVSFGIQNLSIPLSARIIFEVVFKYFFQ